MSKSINEGEWMSEDPVVRQCAIVQMVLASLAFYDVQRWPDTLASYVKAVDGHHVLAVRAAIVHWINCGEPRMLTASELGEVAGRVRDRGAHKAECTRKPTFDLLMKIMNQSWMGELMRTILMSPEELSAALERLAATDLIDSPAPT